MDPDVNERFERLEGVVAGLTEVVSGQADVVSGLLKMVSEHEKGFRKLRLSTEKNDEQLAILIRMMNEWIRSNRRTNGRPRRKKKSR